MRRFSRRWRLLSVSAVTLTVAGCAPEAATNEDAAAPSAAPNTSPIEQSRAADYATPFGTDKQGFVDSPARCDGNDVAIQMLWSYGTTPARFTVCMDSFTGRYMRALAPPESHEGLIPMRGTFFTDTASSVQFVAGDAKIDISPQTLTILWPKRGNVTRSVSWPAMNRWVKP